MQILQYFEPDSNQAHLSEDKYNILYNILMLTQVTFNDSHGGLNWVTLGLKNWAMIFFMVNDNMVIIISVSDHGQKLLLSAMNVYSWDITKAQSTAESD